MKTGYKIVISMSALLVMVFLIYRLGVNYISDASQSERSINHIDTQQHEQPMSNVTESVVSGDPSDEEISLQLPEGVNTLFHDKTEIQIAWMDRGKNIVLKNKPDADSADFRRIFFHRGIKGRPVTCGEVQFSKDGEVIAKFQRFIYVGLRSSHLQHDVTNFDILWDYMCAQVLNN